MCIRDRSFTGGNIALLQDGDQITIDAEQNSIAVELSDEELASRRASWKAPERPVSGILKKYRYTVSSASEGCVTDEL